MVPGAELEVRFFQFFNPTSKRKRDRSPSLFLDLRLCFAFVLSFFFLERTTINARTCA